MVAARDITTRPALFTFPMAGLFPIELAEANRLLERWAHRLGPIHRPFRSETFALYVDQRPVRAAVSYSHNAMHKGSILRADGWTRVSDNCGSRGGAAFGRDTAHRATSHGRKSLWVWVY